MIGAIYLRPYIKGAAEFLIMEEGDAYTRRLVKKRLGDGRIVESSTWRPAPQSVYYPNGLIQIVKNKLASNELIVQFGDAVYQIEQNSSVRGPSKKS